MRTRRRNRLPAVLLTAVLAFGLAGCGETPLLFRELKASDVQQWATGESTTLADGMLGLANMTRAASDSGTSLYVNPKTTEIAVETADHVVWYSNPQNRLSMNSSLLGRYSSPLLVTVIDSAETSKQMNAFDDCVKNGQFTIKKISGGVRVEYHFGSIVKTPLYPQVFTAERFQEILSGLSKTEQNNMKRYYLEVNYDTVTDQQSKQSLEKKYTRIGEVKHIYVLKQSTSALESNRISEYLTRLGYTQ